MGGREGWRADLDEVVRDVLLQDLERLLCRVTRLVDLQSKQRQSDLRARSEDGQD